jgi:4-amino-4-deoxy-L-arabinose transferase-like glycosyltransferase
MALFEHPILKSKGLFIVILTVFLKIPALVFPKAIDDERIYSVVAVEMLNGGVSYIDAIERKPPLLFWTYKAILGIGGEYNWYFLHLVSLAWVLFTAWGVYKVAKQVFDENAGLVAAGFYSIYSSWAFWNNLALNGELLMNLPVVWSIYLVFRNSSTHRFLELLFAGAMLCCGFLLKQPAAIMAVPLGIYLLSKGYKSKTGITTFTALFHAATLTAGFFAMLAMVAYILYVQGNLEAAYYWTIGDHDVPHSITDPVFWQRGIGMTLVFCATCGVIVWGSLGAIKSKREQDGGLWKGNGAEFWALILLMVAALIGLLQPGRFYPHYYIQIVPILCIVSAPYFSAIWTGRRKEKGWLLRPLPSALWVGVTAVGFSISHCIGVAKHWEPSSAGQYLLTHSQPADEIFVWGQSSNIYLDAQRKAATRYVATFPLTGHIFGSPLTWDPNFDTSDRILPGAWDNLRADFVKAAPQYIVDCDAARAVPRYPITDFKYLHAVIDNCYSLEAKTADGYIYKKKLGDCPQAIDAAIIK